MSNLFYTILVIALCLIIWYSPFWVGLTIISLMAFLMLHIIIAGIKKQLSNL